MSLQGIGWKILHLVWSAKGYGGKEVPALLQENCPNVTGLGESTIGGKVRRNEVAPPEVAEYVLQRMEVRKGSEWRTEIVQLGVAALLGQPLPQGSKPADAAEALRAEFPTDEVALKLADALAKQGGLLEAMGAKLEALLSSLASGVTSGLGALSSSLSGKLDALASSIVSLLTTLAGVRRTLDAMNGKLDNVLGTLGLVAATVNDVDAQGEASKYQRADDTRTILQAVRWVGLVGLVGFAMVAVLLVGVLFAVRQAQLDATRAEATSATRLTVGTDQAHPLPATLSEGSPPHPLPGTMPKGCSRGVATGERPSTKGQSVPSVPVIKDQARAPCRGVETTINGLCWIGVAGVNPPCPADTFVHGNTCYIPSGEGEKRPSSAHDQSGGTTLPAAPY